MGLSTEEYRKRWNRNRRHVSLPEGWWERIRQLLAYLQTHGVLGENMTSFWERAARAEFHRTMREYGLSDEMIARMDPQDYLKQGRPKEKWVSESKTQEARPRK